MRRRADILAATAMAVLLAPCLAAAQVTYQQSSVNNQQDLFADVLSTGTLNVVQANQTTSTSTATGNGYSASASSGNLDVQSQQYVDADVRATNTVTVQDYSPVSMTSAATGNSGDITSLGYGDVTGTISQSVENGRNVTASSILAASTAEIGESNVQSQAFANSQGFSVVGGETRAQVNQASGGITEAYTEGRYRWGQEAATFAASAISNNVTAAGIEGADQGYSISQSMTGDRTQASVLAVAANAQEINGAATAVANNIAATNEYNPLQIHAEQTNAGYVRAESDVYAFDFGAGTASAYGVGNSVVAGNLGADLDMNIDQSNTGAVQSFAKFEGNDGYDAYGSAVSIGNASTGYACSSCENAINVTNRQSNSNLVTASTTINIGGSNRSVVGTASAVGNSATYYVSRPN